jgi:phosphate transport system substrate-binding protein
MLLCSLLLGLGLSTAIGGTAPAGAEQSIKIKFSCSAQLYDILQFQILQEFSRATGIQVDAYVTSSEAALYRLYNQACDVAGTAERIDFSHGEYGYTETPICTAPIIVITHPANPVDSVTQEQLHQIFCGEIISWQNLGGIDQQILAVVPDTSTAAYKNFSRLALKRFDIDYTIMTKRSTMVVKVVQHLPGSISFITKGSDARDRGIKILKVDGVPPAAEAYPYYQSFSLVTKSNPSEGIKSFIDFICSQQTAERLRADGILPASRR